MQQLTGLRKKHSTDSKLTLKGTTALFNVIFIFLVILLPSGTIANVNIKLLSIIPMVGLNLTFILVNSKLTRQSVRCLLITIVALIFIGSSFIISTYYGNPDNTIKTETTLFASFFIPCFFLYTSINEGSSSKELVLKAILYTSALYSFIKVGLIAVSAVGILPLSLVSAFIEQESGITPMLLPITDSISRFQLANDFIICFVSFFMICRRDAFHFVGKVKFTIIYWILLLGVFISFSRYMFIILALGVFLKLLLIRRVKFSGIAFFVSIVIALSTVMIVYNQEVSDAFSLRFDSSKSNISDEARHDQVQCLLGASLESPILGHGGIGGFNRACPGPYGFEYSYDVQYLGFVYRFGFPLTFFVLLLYVSQLTASMKDSLLTMRNLPTLAGLTMWMGIGLFNPYLISGYAAVIMVLFLCMSRRRDD